MDSYVVKICCGNEFMSMYNNLNNFKEDRLITISGISLEELESFIERLTMKVFSVNISNRIINGTRTCFNDE